MNGYLFGQMSIMSILERVMDRDTFIHRLLSESLVSAWRV